MARPAAVAALFVAGTCLAAAALGTLGPVVLADGEIELPRERVAGGGATQSDGGAFAMGGTAGQPEAGMVSGGAYTVTGGFWVADPDGARAEVAGAAVAPERWYTVDHGGLTHASGAMHALGGTAGQPDAGVASGGAYTVTGGFWTAESAAALPAGGFWYTVDDGGLMWANGGSFAVGGTAGQADAGLLRGGGYALSGGFWQEAVPVSPTPTPALSPTPTRTPTRTPTPEPTRLPTSTPTPHATSEEVDDATPLPPLGEVITPTSAASSTASSTASPATSANASPTPSSTASPTLAPSATKTSTPTPTPSATQTRTPTVTPKPTFTATPTAQCGQCPPPTPTV